MTVDDLIEELQRIRSDGHGKAEIGVSTSGRALTRNDEGQLTEPIVGWEPEENCVIIDTIDD